MATYKQNFISSLNFIANTIKKDGNWKYSQKTDGYYFTKARNGHRTGNCAHFVCWALRDVKMLPSSGWFYLNNGKIYYNGTRQEDVKKYIDKYFKIIKINKPLLKAGLKRGDIIGFHNLSHTCVFDKYSDDKKHAYVWDGGSAANVNGIKKNIHRQKDSYGHNVAIILRPKTFYYKKPVIKTESIVKALDDIKVDSSYANRKKIAILNGINDYKGTALQNTLLVAQLYKGKLIKC